MSIPQPEPANSPQKAEGDIYTYIADRFREGRTAEDVHKLLVANGYPESSATSLIEEVIDGPAEQESSRPGRQKFRKGRDQSARLQEEMASLEGDMIRAAGQKNMIYGACWCIGGLAVTLLSLAAASGPGGGRFIMAWGAIIFGAIQFFKGAAQAGNKS